MLRLEWTHVSIISIVNPWSVIFVNEYVSNKNNHWNNAQ